MKNWIVKSLLKVLRKLVAICNRFPLTISVRQITDSPCIRTLVFILNIPLAICFLILVLIRNKICENKKKDFPYKVSIAAIIKNEGPYLLEWIRYHQIIGIDHFFLIDNDSNDKTRDILDDLIQKKLVTYMKMKGKERQVDAYNYVLNKFSYSSKYIAFIDADEFIFLPNFEMLDYNMTIEQVINNILKIKRSSGLAINWCMFGTSNYDLKPDGLVIENFNYRAFKNFESNLHVKTICNPRLIFGFRGVHIPECYYGMNLIDEKGEYVTSSKTDHVNWDIVRINHYFTKSRQEYELKRKRGMANRRGIRHENNFERYNKNDVYDISMSKYVPIVKSSIMQI